MLLPSKLFSFSESSLCQFAPTLELLESGPMTLSALQSALDISTQELEHLLGALYALRAIDLNDQNEVFTCL